MQKILVILVLVLALIYLGWQFYGRFIRKEKSCDGCAFNQGDKSDESTHK